MSRLYESSFTQLKVVRVPGQADTVILKDRINIYLIYLGLKLHKIIKQYDIKTKQSSSGILYGNITLFGVAADQLHPADSGDPLPPQTEWYYHIDHQTQVVLL